MNLSIVNQLRRHIEHRILDGDSLDEVKIPLHGSSIRYLQDPDAPAGTDALVNFSPTDRLLCLADSANTPVLDFREGQHEQVIAAIEARRVPRTVEACSRPSRPDILRVRLRELRRFLLDPLEAGI